MALKNGKIRYSSQPQRSVTFVFLHHTNISTYLLTYLLITNAPLADAYSTKRNEDGNVFHIFGFKTGYGCRNAIFAVCRVVKRLIKGGSTANVRAIDLNKAFDKVNHCALYIKLMKRHTPVELLEVLENWL